MAPKATIVNQLALVADKTTKSYENNEETQQIQV